MRAIAAMLAALLGFAGPGSAGEDRAGDFDYYILSLSWSPAWCLREGDDRGAPECRTGAGHGFILHGLWPQHDIGWPSDCATPARPPGRRDLAQMGAIMGSAGLARHQWRKHGTCTGLDGAAYFDLARRAFGAVRMPGVLSDLDRDVELPARVIEDAFLEANPAMERSAITITCARGMIAEVRICLTRDLGLRACGPDAARDCRMRDALLPAPR